MNNIPTPRTDAESYETDTAYEVVSSDFARTLERELTTVTEQRDDLLRYNEAYRQDALICANCDAISVKEYKEAIEQRNGLRSAVDYASDQLTRVTEQRDRLAEALQKNLLTTWIDEIEFEVFREAIAALKEETDDR